MESQAGSRLRGPALEALPEARSRKACVNCRRQKMKCRIDDGAPSCRRCARAGTQCVFVPRANAASFEVILPKQVATTAEHEPRSLNDQILWRLRRIEDHVGLSEIDDAVAPSSTSQTPPRAVEEESYDDATLRPLSDAIQALKSACSGQVNKKIWNESLVKRLWSTFHDTMLGLHFFPRKQSFSSPTPIMLAAMLYCSSIRGAPVDAEFAPEYFSVLCIAISQLCVPSSIIGRVPTDPDPKHAEEWAFQTILGIILAGLLREGISKETGIWISVAYRLILEHCPPSSGESSLEWQRLFTGLQIVDLEHASVHLSCPVVPIVAPFPCLRISPQDHIYRLSRMMHTGLSHFAGRGLPTIWSGLSSETPKINRPADCVTVSFSGVDAAVIRDWARQLDDWFVEFGARQDDPESERRLAIRQYILHRVLVLSVYLPARGSDLFSDTTPKEQHELLVSARDAVKLQIADRSIWSNFDLVVITWAALIVIQGVEGGVGEPDDLDNVNAHLAKLRESPALSSSVNGVLANRLDQKLQALHTPIPGGEDAFQLDGEFDTSWFIFNQGSLQSGFDLLSYDNQI